VQKEIRHASATGKPVLPIIIDPLRPRHPLTGVLAKHQYLSPHPLSFEELSENVKARLAQALRDAHARRPVRRESLSPPPIPGR
jgi:hypothetical protein